ncbi:hypothetical protein CF394_03430 [Tetzosporium hominis]|uniref:Uncharacterized protein n=1 Tax=Tetzosporium hominis TaxID=2020506 RepID=A0A264W5V6_9BACL|nr:hypothetical protein [Tetzosporium hominis]OZS78954.1 hypothetical protein CF394_03430 [Tetzosporium hominis]
MKKLMVVLAFALLFFVTNSLENKVFASELQNEEEFVETVNGVAEENGFTVISDPTLIPETTLKFDSVEDFEAFLETEKLKETNPTVFTPPTSKFEFATLASTNPKTYTYKEYTGVSVITSYARVTRNTSGVVTKVVVWSDQSGVTVPIKYAQTTAWYTLNSSKKGGTATIKGTKFYGVNVVGQELGYARNVTYTVPF